MASLLDWRDGKLFACALVIEQAAAYRLGQTILVGVAARKLIMPSRPVVSFGFAGALCDDLPVASIVDATKVVDETGTLWEGKPLGVRGARQVTIFASDRIINNADERRDLCKRFGAHVVDMESGIYARKNIFEGGLRSVSDTPKRPLGSIPALWFGGSAYWALANITK